MDSVTRDVRFALRSLRHRWLFTMVAVLALGLGIGGTTAMFSVVDGVLIKDLPYEDPGSLVSVWKAWPDWRGQPGLDYVWDHIQIPWDDYLSIREGTPAFTDVAAYQNDDNVLYGRGEPLAVSTGLASANLFPLLGVVPVIGRGFAGDEVPPQTDPAAVVMLSHELWQGRFGADPTVIGQTVRLGDRAYEVIGVLPDRFRLGSDLIQTHDNGGAVDSGLRDVWLPLGSDGVDCGNCFELLARLAPGHTLDEARAQVRAALTAPAPGDQVARVVPRKDVVTRGFRGPLFTLFGAAGLLLLVACTNVAGLLLGEAPRRTAEIAVRAALGAGRGRIVRQLLTESAILGVVGAAAGVLIAVVGTDVLLSVAPPLPRLEEIGISVRVLAFATGAGLLTGVLFGLAPTLSLSRRSGHASLRLRGGTARHRWMQSSIVSVQVCLTVVLLVAGGLFGRSLSRVMSVDPGFEAGRMATLHVAIPPGRSAEHEDARRFYDDLLRVLRSLPGVESASVTSNLPFPGGSNSHSFRYDRGGEELTSTQWARWVDPSYFETLGIPLFAGRLLEESDVADAPKVMVVSRSLAERNWPGESPIGARIGYFGPDDWVVVGVVGDVRQKALGAPVEATFYVSSRQLSRRSMDLVVRTSEDPSAAIPRIEDAIRTLDPEIPISNVASMTELIRASEADERFRSLLMWTFAAWAVVLASIGLFGVTARAVAARSREIGIRSALGARAGRLVALIVRDGLASAFAGVAAGLVGAYWAAALVGHLLYGIDARDPVTFVAAALLSVCVCLGAVYAPARGVTAISPAEVLSEE